MGRRPVTIASLLTFTCAAGSMVVAPINAEGAGFHEGWCQKDEGFAVVLYWPAKPADVKPEVPGNLNSKTLVRCIIGSHNVSGPDGRADALTPLGSESQDQRVQRCCVLLRQRTTPSHHAHIR